MNFAEIRFWGYLAAGLAVILLLRLLLRPVLQAKIERFDRLSLIVLGLFLLACVSWVTLVIFIVVAVSSYFGLNWILVSRAKEHQHRFLWILIPIQILPLLYYKYANFALNQVIGLEFSVLKDLVIPVGISFYSFQMVAFVIDTLAYKKPLPRFLDFLNFAGFFPQIVAGPIERRADLLPQVERFRFRYSLEDLNEGVSWVVLGLFFKLCLADNVAQYFYGASTTNPVLIWMDNMLFGLRIYYDFAGYSLVAIGLGRCLGIRLTLNFQSPYCSTSIAEFWRRWHITLSQWFRDYLYVPLGGGRTPRWMINVAIVFIVSGIWHGAGWNFVVWGALHGAYLIVNRSLGKKLKLPAIISWFLTFMGAMLAWLCFYETRNDAMWSKLAAVFNPLGYSGQALRDALAARPGSDWLVLAGFVALSTLVLLAEWWSVARKNEPYYYIRRPAVLMLLVVLTIFLAPGKNNAFIYFAF